MASVLEDKEIILGVTGGIAAYKSVELLRLLTGAGARVRVVMTASAEHFVGPMTFEALSGRPVFDDLFEKGGGEEAPVKHIEWAQAADGVIIAPATANIIGKMANGIADDALSTILLAVSAPVMFCPAMNTQMYLSRQVVYNLERLDRFGYAIMDPDQGDLACGTTGPGRLPDPGKILDRFVALLTENDLAGKKVLVTAGPTWEAIDPVRFISNPSSGKMGYAIARAAEHRGADTTLISGPVALPDPQGVAVKRVTSAAEMAEAVFAVAGEQDIIIKAAAVSDYRPNDVKAQKIKKSEDSLTVVMEKNQDILLELGRRKSARALVGFAAETQSLAENARQKLKAKNTDIIVGNTIGEKGSGFQCDTNRVTLFYRDGSREELPPMEKSDVAHALLDRVLARVLS